MQPCCIADQIRFTSARRTTFSNLPAATFFFARIILIGKDGPLETEPLKSLKCLVLIPIGAEKSETRARSDALMSLVIRPALEVDMGYCVQRGDEIGAQWITPELVEAIRLSDLVVAVLTDLNPNVFFEMGVAQAWCRPMVALAERDTKLPFDVKDLNTVFYPRIGPGSALEETDAVECRELLKQLAAVASQTVGHSPFHQGLSIIGSRYSLGAIYSGKRFILEVFEAGIQDVIGAMEKDYELVEEGKPDGLRRLAPDLEKHAEFFHQQSRALHKSVRVADLPLEIGRNCLKVCDLMAQTCQQAMRLADRMTRKLQLDDGDVVFARSKLVEFQANIAEALVLISQNKKELV